MSRAGLTTILPRHLWGRVWLLIGVLTFDQAVRLSLPHPNGYSRNLLRFGIAAGAIFLGLGRTYLKRHKQDLPFSAPLFAAHFLCVAAFIFGTQAGVVNAFPAQTAMAVFLGLHAVLLAGFVLLALACAPGGVWFRMVRETSPAWLYSAFAGLAAVLLNKPFQFLWGASSNAAGQFLQTITFKAVGTVLVVFLPGVLIHPAAATIDAPHFSVCIMPACSGIEGLELVLGFAAVWFLLFRRETRFPHALLLVPVALVCIWTLNVVRLSALILIGSAISPDAAMGGFHSRAGWIAFTAVALGFAMAAQRIPWMRKEPESAALSPGAWPQSDGIKALGDMEQRIAMQQESPATAAFLVPMLAILAASFISKAASASFEWLYPLRFVAGAAALWHFRAHIKKMDWRFGWGAFAVGGAVFLMWIAPAAWAQNRGASTLGPALASLPLSLRLAWIVFRVAAASITVPVAEELAFRGYLARRIMDCDFDRISFRHLTLSAVAVSSLAFGLMHGPQWIPGTLAGIAFACLLRWRSRFGEAVAAHALTNLFLAAWVLSSGDWSQW